MKHEINLIGSVIEVIGSDNKDCIGIKGKVVDETKSTIVVFDSKNKKCLLKNAIIIQMQDKAIIEGKNLNDDLVSRLKQKNKKNKVHAKTKGEKNDKTKRNC